MHSLGPNIVIILYTYMYYMIGFKSLGHFCYHVRTSLGNDLRSINPTANNE